MEEATAEQCTQVSGLLTVTMALSLSHARVLGGACVCTCVLLKTSTVTECNWSVVLWMKKDGENNFTDL